MKISNVLKTQGWEFISPCFAFLAAFAIVWQIIWLIIVGLIGVIACVITLSFDDEMEYVLPAAEVAKIEKSYET